MPGDFDLNPADYAADTEGPHEASHEASDDPPRVAREFRVTSRVPEAFRPGSHNALRAGCTCPRIDNAYGRGVPTSLLVTLWWCDAACPYHLPPAAPAEPGE